MSCVSARRCSALDHLCSASLRTRPTRTAVPPGGAHMPGAMRKLGLYLGLVEDDEDGRHGGYADDDSYYDEPEAPTRAYRTDPGPRSSRPHFGDAPQTRGSMALDTSPVAAHRPHVAPAPAHDDSYRITTLTPRTYNEARTIGENFRDGTPVIMNLTEMDDVDAKRLVDFAAGLIFGLRGSIERGTNKGFLLSPEHVEGTAEDKALIVGGGFFTQPGRPRVPPPDGPPIGLVPSPLQENRTL